MRLKNPFYPLTQESYGAYAVMCLSVVIFGTGIIGNLAVMCIVCHNYYMRSISNSLLANLAHVWIDCDVKPSKPQIPSPWRSCPPLQ